MNFVIFPFPLRVTHLMVRFQLSYERHVSKMSIHLRTSTCYLASKKSDSCLKYIYEARTREVKICTVVSVDRAPITSRG